MNVGILDDLKMVVIYEVVEKGIHIGQQREKKQDEERDGFPAVFRRRLTTVIAGDSFPSLIIKIYIRSNPLFIDLGALGWSGKPLNVSEK